MRKISILAIVVIMMIVTIGAASVDTNDAAKKHQTITFNPLPDQTYGNTDFGPGATVANFNIDISSEQAYGNTDFSLNAKASSGLPVSFSVITGPITISGKIVTMIGTGLATIRASQAGDSSYYAASNVDRSFNIVPQQTSGGAVQGKVFNDLDKDKKLDKGEPGIADVVVQLTGGDKKTKKFNSKVNTDANGNYIFPNLPNGKYKVHVVTKHRWLYTTSTSKSVTIKNGNVVIVNFGEKPDNKNTNKNGNNGN